MKHNLNVIVSPSILYKRNMINLWFSCSAYFNPTNIKRRSCFILTSSWHLQAQIGELQKMLESMQSIEEEVQAIRREKSELERDMERASSVQKQGSGGAWKWITG